MGSLGKKSFKNRNGTLGGLESIGHDILWITEEDTHLEEILIVSGGELLECRGILRDASDGRPAEAGYLAIA